MSEENPPTLAAIEADLRSRAAHVRQHDRTLFVHLTPSETVQMANLVKRLAKLEALAKELAEFAIDAAYQGSGQKPLSSPSWHSFISTWEEADQLFRRADFRELLSDKLRAWLDGERPEREYANACPHCEPARLVFGRCPKHIWMGRVNEDVIYPEFRMVQPVRGEETKE